MVFRKSEGLNENKGQVSEEALRFSLMLRARHGTAGLRGHDSSDRKQSDLKR